MPGTCKALRTVERIFDLLPPVDKSMEVMGSVVLLFVVIYRGEFSDRSHGACG